MAESQGYPQSDPLTELICLEQTGNVQDYFGSFKLMLSRTNISEDLAIEVFLRGLETEIEICVRSLKPKSLQEAYSIAWLKETAITYRDRTFGCDSPVLSIEEVVVVDEFGSEIGLEAAKEGSENDVFEVFEKMPKLNDVEGLPSEHEVSYRDKSGCFQGSMDQPSRINRDYKISTMAETRRPRVKPHLYPSRYKGNLRLGKGNLKHQCTSMSCYYLILLLFDEPWGQGSSKRGVLIRVKYV